MKKIVFIALSVILPFALSAQKIVVVSVSNTEKTPRADQPVILPLKSYGPVASALVTCQGQEIPCQLDDLDQDDVPDELCFLADVGGKEEKQYTVELSSQGAPRAYPARVYAEMLMRNDKVKQKNRHDNFIESITARGDCANSYNLQHHHGVAFESELNGIRIYFDKRQTLDLYGKFKKRLEIKETQFYTDDEQKKNGYGDDVLWVGQTFGLGAFRGWDGNQPTMIDPVKSRTQRIIAYGPLRTIVEILDRGWTPDNAKAPINMVQRYTQYAGHRDTDIDVFFNGDVSDRTFSTGIINVKDSEEYSDKKGLRACWGTDYPSTDTLKWKRETVGLAICIPQNHIIKEVPATSPTAPKNPDGENYAFVVATKTQHIHYKVAYCYAKEENGPHSATEWFGWLKNWKQDLNHPLDIRVE